MSIGSAQHALSKLLLWAFAIVQWPQPALRTRVGARQPVPEVEASHCGSCRWSHQGTDDALVGVSLTLLIHCLVLECRLLAAMLARGISDLGGEHSFACALDERRQVGQDRFECSLDIVRADGVTWDVGKGVNTNVIQGCPVADIGIGAPSILLAHTNSTLSVS